jgi:voltage-gated sodium channel
MPERGQALQDDAERHESADSTLRKALESAAFRHLITVLIILNAVILGVLTYELPDPRLRSGLEGLDKAIIWIFVVEITMKLVIYRLGFFRSGWNWFDFLVVGVAILPFAQGLSVLRALRVLRILRLLHLVPMLRRITEALLKALPGMGAILTVLALLTYVAAVMATNMFGTSDSEEVRALFGTLPRSAFTLFQVMTMDGWRNEVVQIVIDDGHPYAWIFFLAFIFLASFAILNLFIALIVEALQAEQEAAQEAHIGKLEADVVEAGSEREAVLLTLEQVRAELAELRADREGGGP